MSDRRKFDYLLAGLGETPRSLVGECIDYTVNFTVEPLAIAQRRWRYAELIRGNQHDR